MMKFFRLFFVFFLLQSALFCKEFIITSLDDSGKGTLREALNLVQEKDVITFDPLLSGKITLHSLLPPINASVKICGTSGNITISGNYQFPVFQINSGTIEINDVKIAEAASGGSGAGLFIADCASVGFARGAFNDCIAMGIQGGAVHVGDKATLKITDTTFSGNTSEGPGDDIFLSKDSLVMYTATKNIPPIKVFGEGNLCKLGEGIATFKVPSAAAINLVAQGGTTISTGVRTKSTIILPGARLEGTQTIFNIFNNGTMKPSETIGTSILRGDYCQAIEATLEIAITPETNDLLKIYGDVSLQGMLFINPTDGCYSKGTSYTIMKTKGNISGKFDTVKSSNMVFEVHYLPQSIEIEISDL